MRDFTADQREWLLRAQEIGFIGPKPVETVYRHALGFAQCIDELLRVGLLPPSFYCADLGSGAGIPGLFLSMWFSDSRFVLVDSMRKRYLFLEGMIGEFQLGDRVSVYEGRSEECARSPQYREAFDLVTARGFASPAATAENGCGLLHRNGVLLVSEPPGSSGSRWPKAKIRRLGFSSAVCKGFEFSYCWMLKDLEVRGKFPREVGIPEKFPLF